MTQVVGTPRNYDQKWNFRVEIEGTVVGWFVSCSELSDESSVIEQHEGGNPNVADQSPGKVKFTPVTLAIGSTDNTELYAWRQEVIDATAGTGLPNDEYKRTVTIIQLDRDGSEKRQWILSRAWPSKYVAGDWDGKADENVIEQVTLTYISYKREELN